MITLVGYGKCSTCKAIEKLLKAKNITYSYREITEDIPSVEELMHWYKLSKLDSIKKLMNTSGTLYRQENLKDKLNGLNDKQQFECIAKNGMLIKRPILIVDQEEVYVGKDVQAYITERE